MEEPKQDAPVTSSQPAAASGRQQRRSRWVSSWEALNQISRVVKAGMQYRTADKVTDFLIFGFVLAMTGLFVFPTQVSALSIICDSLFGLVILFYVAQRLGIFFTFNDRQVFLAAELMFGFFLMGMFVVINYNWAIAAIRDILMSLTSYSH